MFRLLLGKNGQVQITDKLEGPICWIILWVAQQVIIWHISIGVIENTITAHAFEDSNFFHVSSAAQSLNFLTEKMNFQGQHQ